MRHKNVIEFKGVCIILDKYCILMPLMKHNLKDYYTEIEKMKNSERWIERLRISMQIIEGLLYVHYNAIAHLDLKPTNILVNIYLHWLFYQK